MNKSILMSTSLALALSLTACDPAAGPAENNAAVGAAASADADTVKQVETAFLAAITAKDVAAVKSNYASDATMVLPQQAPMKGIAAIAADYDKFAADPAGKFAANNESTVVSSGGDLAYSQGTYTVSYTSPQTKAVVNANGYYLVVYKKQADGSWKIVQDVSSALPDAA